jgi:Peptidase family M23
MLRLRRLTRVAVPLLAASAVAVSGLAVANQAAASTPMASGSSYWHPYSNPIWYPLRGSYGTMDCASSNPGCSSAKLHKDASMTVLSRKMQGNTPVYKAEPVYAAGAGILHIGANVGDRCQYPSSLGTWLWVDHGGGVVSRYGHLSGIISSIHNGEYVTPKTIIGYTGHSGESSRGDCSRATHYLNFQIEHNGLYGTPIRQTRLAVCNGSKSVWWPQAAHSSESTWQSVPAKATLDNSGQSATSCVGTRWWSTASLPTTHPLSAGSGRLRASWATPAAKYHVRYIQLLLEEYHPANHTWSIESRHNITVSGKVPTSYTFGGLAHKRIYEVAASFCNAPGWSKATWRKDTVK